MSCHAKLCHVMVAMHCVTLSQPVSPSLTVSPNITSNVPLSSSFNQPYCHQPSCLQTFNQPHNSHCFLNWNWVVYWFTTSNARPLGTCISNVTTMSTISALPQISAPMAYVYQYKWILHLRYSVLFLRLLSLWHIVIAAIHYCPNKPVQPWSECTDHLTLADTLLGQRVIIRFFYRSSDPNTQIKHQHQRYERINFDPRVLTALFNFLK